MTKPVAFTYALHWSEHGKSYYGVRYAKGCETTDIGTKYFSSSKIVKAFWKEHGAPLIIIDQMFLSVGEAKEYEVEILQENDVVNDDCWLNLHDMNLFSRSAGWKHSDAAKEKMRNARIGKVVSEETREKISKNSSLRRHTDESKLKIAAAVAGRKHSDAAKEKIRNARIGKTYSKESRDKMRLAAVGRKHSDQAKEKMRAAHEARRIKAIMVNAEEK